MSYKTFRYNLFFLVVTIFCITNICSGQDSLEIELDPIKVTALQSVISSPGAPLSVTSLTRDLQSVNHSSSLSLSAVGEQLPGLWINDRQNYALGERLTIRGVGWRSSFGVRGIQVVLDGIPLTVADGQTMINIVEPSFIRKAELIRGPAATYWGNSSGGVLYLSTRPSFDDTSNTRVRLQGGSFGLKKAEASFSNHNSGHKYSAYGSYLSTNGFRDYSAAEILRTGITGSINLTSRSQLRYQAAGIHMPKAQHPSSLTAQQAQNNPQMAVTEFADSAKAGKEITQAQTGLSYLLDTPAGIITINGYGIYRDLSNPLPFGIITVNRWVGGLRSSLKRDWNQFGLQVGIESKLQNDDRTEFDNAGDATRGAETVNQIERVWNQAAFVSGSYRLGNLRFLGGLRFDKLTFTTDAQSANVSGKRNFQALSPNFGVTFKPSNQTLFANISTSFEAPTTTELVNRPGGGNGFNPQLKPEKTIGVETGIRGTIFDQGLQYDVALYRLWISELLFPYQLSKNGPTFYRNQGKTMHSGIEGRLSWTINRELTLSTNINLNKAIFKDALTHDTTSIDGNNVPGIPNFRLNSNIRWSPDSFITSLSYERVSSYAVNNKNTAINDAYNVLDAKFSYKIPFSKKSGTFHPFININNILNQRYNGSVVVNSSGGNYYEPAPGRNWQVGVSFNY
ncbi:iron complex outermembrane recepter protein [Fodinibius salinus]|uniref:Iron complex outermembrane recepter protein n=1 Tax=Fodinibius salinus TaxID=860790 RepID=A0A5D3YQC4_9BACT|nr:TonB-dependent receptor [Fodinibius salinus]TYP95173.1 iron complex outermembrane recepter protein [Fodinibius salinus]